MIKIKFKAIPKIEDLDELLKDGIEPFEGFNDLLDDEGYVHGYYVDGYIVGGVADVTDEYFQPDFWIPVDKNTVLTEKAHGNGLS